MTINLDDLEAIARDATPGPWIADPPSAWDTDDVGVYQLQAAVRVKDSGSITWDDHGGEVFKPADAEFIATFDPPTVLALIAKLREVEAVIEKVREIVEPPKPFELGKSMMRSFDRMIGDLRRTLATHKPTTNESEGKA